MRNKLQFIYFQNVANLSYFLDFRSYLNLVYQILFQKITQPIYNKFAILALQNITKSEPLLSLQQLDKYNQNLIFYTQPLTFKPMTTATTYLDEFIDKMYLVPNDINRHLRLIRTLDKKAEHVHHTLSQQQAKFLNQLKEHKESVNGTMNGSSTHKRQQTSQTSQTSELPTSLRNDYEKIVTRQKQLYGYYREKYEVSQQLKTMVNDFYEQLDVQLKNKMKEKTEQERIVFENRRKAMGKLMSGLNGTSTQPPPSTKPSTQQPQTQQFTYSPVQVKYCYCQGPSFGEMVECENPFCEREWFHVDCIEEKNLPDRWYCINCQKQKDKTRNNVSRGFFLNNRDSEVK